MAQLTKPHSYTPPFPTSETKSTTEYTGKVGIVFQDPANPQDLYMLVDCDAAMVAGEAVVINQDGVASRATSTSVGLLGFIATAVSASDTVAYAQVEGEVTNAILTSGVTTAGFLFAPATTDGGYLDLLTSTEANAVYGARCITAPTTATSDGFSSDTSANSITGVGTVFIKRGGAWLYGIASNHGTVS